MRGHARRRARGIAGCLPESPPRRRAMPRRRRAYTSAKSLRKRSAPHAARRGGPGGVRQTPGQRSRRRAPLAATRSPSAGATAPQHTAPLPSAATWTTTSPTACRRRRSWAQTARLPLRTYAPARCHSHRLAARDRDEGRRAERAADAAAERDARRAALRAKEDATMDMFRQMAQRFT